MKTLERNDCITVFDQNLCVLAGAGSGKTTLLVERFLNAITQCKFDPERILAITFTEKAAHEMKNRLVAECLGRGLLKERRRLENASITTIHSFCARLLRENPVEGGLDPNFRILGEGESDVLMDRVLDRLFEEEAESASWIRMLLVYGEEGVRKALKQFYETVRAFTGEENENSLFSYEKSENEKKEFQRVFRSFQSAYEGEKKSRGAYDFQDLLFLAFRLLFNPSVAHQDVRRRLQERFSAILVDEVQDTSLLQFRLIGLLRSKDNLFVVGDSQQSIYGFRHAEPALLEELSGRSPTPKRSCLPKITVRVKKSLIF